MTTTLSRPHAQGEVTGAGLKRISSINSINGGQWLHTQRTVWKLWLQGKLLDDIADEVKLDHVTVRNMITVAREDLVKLNGLMLRDMAEESISVLKLVQTTAWNSIAQGLPSSKYLSIITKAEEVKAKIRGLLTDRVLHMGEIGINIKLYDFDDKAYPPSAGSGVVDSNGQSLDANGQRVVDSNGQPITPESNRGYANLPALPVPEILLDQVRQISKDAALYHDSDRSPSYTPPRPTDETGWSWSTDGDRIPVVEAGNSPSSGCPSIVNSSGCPVESSDVPLLVESTASSPPVEVTTP